MASTQGGTSSKYDYEKLDDPSQPKPNKVSPKKLIGGVFLTLLGFSLLQQPLTKCYHQVSQHICGAHAPPSSIDTRVREILTSTPLIDGHVDFPVFIRAFYGNHIYGDNFTKPFENGKLPGQVDLARLRQGLSGGAFWSVFAPCPENGTDMSDENYDPVVRFTLDQIDVMTRIQQEYPNDFSQKLDSSSALQAFKEGKLISPLGVEGLHQIGNSVANLRKFHDLGVRYATLTHNCHNKFADAAILENPMRASEPLWGGVSPKGRELVNEMNRLGMIVDLSHVSQDTMVDVLGGSEGWQGSKAPVIFSHSSAYSVCPHPRNVRDEVLELVKDRNSLVMVNIAPDFISCVDTGADNGLPETDTENATLKQYVKHIMHIGNQIGFDHVGIGSDFDGIPSTPSGLEDVTKYVDIVAALLEQGVSDEDAGKIVGGNLLRVWNEVDAVAARLQAHGEPIMEDDLQPLLE